MKLPIYQIDAFTSTRFSGNPASVVVLEQWLPDEQLQAVAAENNLSETAFVLSKGEILGLRWFTPTVEVDLCGHATLAAGHVLFETGRVPGEGVVFETRSGRLTVRKAGRLLSMDFPARPPVRGLNSEEITDALGAHPNEVHRSTRDILAVFDAEADVARLSPRFDRLTALDLMAVIATAPGQRADFVSRFFAPKVGIPEDPVTGSAHCVLTPYWSQRLRKTKLHALQISRRGGELFCEDRGERVTISGEAVEYLRGEISL